MDLIFYLSAVIICYFLGIGVAFCVFRLYLLKCMFLSCFYLFFLKDLSVVIWNRDLAFPLVTVFFP